MTDDFHVELYRGSRQDLRPLFELAEDSAAELGSRPPSISPRPNP